MVLQHWYLKEGWLAYEIPDNLGVDDIVVSYSDGNFMGDWTARWRES